MSDSHKNGTGATLGGLGVLVLLAKLCAGHVDDAARVAVHSDEIWKASRVGTHVAEDGVQALEHRGAASRTPLPNSLHAPLPPISESAEQPSSEIGRRVLSDSDSNLPPGSFWDDASVSAYRVRANDRGELRNLALGENRAVVSIEKAIILREQITSVRLISALPEDPDEFARVYRRRPTMSDERHIAIQKTRSGDGHADSWTSFVDRLQRDRDSFPVIVIAHSEDRGRVIVLPDGSRVAVEDVHRQCAAAQTRCVVVTCYGSDVKLTTEIAPGEAFQMFRIAQAYSRHMNGNGTVDELTRVMRFDLRLRRASKQLALSCVIAGGGTASVELYRRRET